MDYSVVISVIALAASGYTFWRNHRHNRQVLATRVFLELREDYISIAKDIPYQHRNPTWLPESTEDIHLFEAYWYQCINEWYVTTHLYEDALKATLWEEFFMNSILRAMGHTSFRAVFCALRDCPKERYGGHEVAFFEEMSAAYSETYGEDVTDDIAPEDIDSLKRLLGCLTHA